MKIMRKRVTQWQKVGDIHWGRVLYVNVEGLENTVVIVEPKEFGSIRRLGDCLGWYATIDKSPMGCTMTLYKGPLAEPFSRSPVVQWVRVLTGQEGEPDAKSQRLEQVCAMKNLSDAAFSDLLDSRLLVGMLSPECQVDIAKYIEAHKACVLVNQELGRPIYNAARPVLEQVYIFEVIDNGLTQPQRAQSKIS